MATRSRARSSACGAADAVVYSDYKKNECESVGGDFCGIYAVCAGCKGCSLTVDIYCRRILPDFGGGCDSCCEAAEEEEEKATRA